MHGFHASHFSNQKIYYIYIFLMGHLTWQFLSFDMLVHTVTKDK